MVALFEQLGEMDAQVAMLGLMLGTVAALGAAIHGGYDLANVCPPAGRSAGGGRAAQLDRPARPADLRRGRPDGTDRRQSHAPPSAVLVALQA